MHHESSLTNFPSKSTTTPPSSTCQLSFLEFQFRPIFSKKKKKRKKIRRISLLSYHRSNIPFEKNPSIYFFLGKRNFKRARIIVPSDGNSIRITRPGLTPFLRSIFCPARLDVTPCLATLTPSNLRHPPRDSATGMCPIFTRGSPPLSTAFCLLSCTPVSPR